MIEVLKIMKKNVKFIGIKGPREARLPGIRRKICSGGRDLTVFLKFARGMLTLGIDRYINDNSSHAPYQV